MLHLTCSVSMARCLAGGTLMPSGRRPHSWHPASSLLLIGLLLIGICSGSSASLVEPFVTILSIELTVPLDVGVAEIGVHPVPSAT